MAYGSRLRLMAKEDQRELDERSKEGEGVEGRHH